MIRLGWGLDQRGPVLQGWAASGPPGSIKLPFGKGLRMGHEVIQPEVARGNKMPEISLGSSLLKRSEKFLVKAF